MLIRAGNVLAVAGAVAAVLAGCGGSASRDEAGSCDPEDLVWIYHRVTEPESHSYPKTIFRFHDGSETALTDDDASQAPSVSPDGRRIVFQRGSEGDPESAGYSRFRLHVMDSDGGDDEPLLDETDEIQVTDATLAWDAHPAWSPDGSRIAFLRNVSAQAPEPDTHQVMVFSVEGRELRPLPGATGGLYGPAPAWSADSTRLAWIAESTLFWSSLDGHDIREVPLAGTPTSPPAWIDADRAIAVRVDDRLHRFDTETGARTEVAGAAALRALWTLPTGQLAGLDGPEERSRLVVMDVDEPYEPHEAHEITTIEGSRIMPEGSVGDRARSPVNAVPARPGGWSSCRGS